MTVPRRLRDEGGGAPVGTGWPQRGLRPAGDAGRGLPGSCCPAGPGRCCPAGPGWCGPAGAAGSLAGACQGRRVRLGPAGRQVRGVRGGYGGAGAPVMRGASQGRSRRPRPPGQLTRGQLRPRWLVPELGRLVPVPGSLRWSRWSSPVAPLWSVITRTPQIRVRTRDLRYTPPTHRYDRFPRMGGCGVMPNCTIANRSHRNHQF
jgi:hypothetical protein